MRSGRSRALLLAAAVLVAALVPSIPVQAKKKHACPKAHVYHFDIEISASNHYTFVSDDSQFPGTQKGDLGWSEVYNDVAMKVKHDCRNHSTSIDMPPEGQDDPVPASSTSVFDVTDSRVSTRPGDPAAAKRPCQFHATFDDRNAGPGVRGKLHSQIYPKYNWSFAFESGIGSMASEDELLVEAYIQSVRGQYDAGCPEHSLEAGPILTENFVVGHQSVAPVDFLLPGAIIFGNGPSPAPSNVQGLAKGEPPTDLATGNVPYGSGAPGEDSGTWSLRVSFTRVIH